MGLFSDKLRAAQQIITEFNDQMAAAKDSERGQNLPCVKYIDPEKFVEKLVVYGGVADELLRQCTWEDLENCGLPRLLARKIAKVFRADRV